MNDKILNNKYLIIGGLVILVGVVYFFTSKGNTDQFATVKLGTVTEEIAITGKTKPVDSVDIGFDDSGRIAVSRFKVGDKVSQGQVVAELDIRADLATLDKERALLSEATSKLGDEGSKVESAIRESYAVVDNAVRNKIDQFYKTPKTNPMFEVKFDDGNFTHYFNVPQDYVIELNNERQNVEGVLIKFQSELLALNSTNSKMFSSMSLEKLNTISKFLDKVAYAVNSFTPAEFAYDSTVTGYKTAIDSARTAVSTAREGLINADAQGQANVDQIKASISSLEANLSKSRIVAPFNGVITKQDAKVGETATVGTPLISLASLSSMYIEAPVSEIKIGKINLGNDVIITFDAFPGEVFQGKVVFIEPGDTLVDSVPNYNVRIEIIDDPRLKIGLTANISVKTQVKDGVLALPSYTLTKRDGKYFVNKIIAGKIVETEVGVGLVGIDGNAEIVSGLTEGDQVAY